MRCCVIALAACAAVAACGKNEKPPPPAVTDYQQESGPAKRAPANSSAAQAARATFQRVCAMCHGPDGTGNGPAAAALTPKPRNYTDPQWQASITDDEIKRIIVKGGLAVGKSQGMPPNPELEGSPQLDALVAIIRGFAKK